MQNKYVIENAYTGDIIAIVATEEIANHFAKFLHFKCNVTPIEDWDFCYGPIRAFLGN